MLRRNWARLALLILWKEQESKSQPRAKSESAPILNCYKFPMPKPDTHFQYRALARTKKKDVWKCTKKTLLEQKSWADNAFDWKMHECRSSGMINRVSIMLGYQQDQRQCMVEKQLTAAVWGTAPFKPTVSASPLQNTKAHGIPSYSSPQTVCLYRDQLHALVEASVTGKAREEGGISWVLGVRVYTRDQMVLGSWGHVHDTQQAIQSHPILPPEIFEAHVICANPVTNLNGGVLEMEVGHFKISCTNE